MEQELQRPLEDILAEAGGDEAQATALLSRAEALARGSPGEALALADRALEATLRCGAKPLEVQARYLKAMLTAVQGHTAEGRDQLRQAVEIAQEANLPDLTAQLARVLEQWDKDHPGEEAAP
jgi:hypothetical protein